MDLRPIFFAAAVTTMLCSCDSNSGRWIWESREETQAPAIEARQTPQPSGDEPTLATSHAPHGASDQDAPPAGVPAPDGKLVPFAPPPAGADSGADRGSCEIPNLSLPKRYKVYAAGAYSGRQLDFQIDGSGHQASQIDVAVNEDADPVVLMLGAYEPTVWNIGWSARTRIVGVLVSGYHRQVVAGLPPSVPRLISSYDNKGPCGYFYVAEGKLAMLNPISRQLFAQPVDRAYLARQGYVTVGTGAASGYVTDSSQPPGKFRDPDAPLAGEAGLRDAVAKGLLREARVDELRAWESAYRAAQVRDEPPLSGASRPSSGSANPIAHNAYVVLKPMRIPAGLYGAHSATFIVPKGTPRPTGNPGHSVIYDYNTMTCVGAICRME